MRSRQAATSWATPRAAPRHAPDVAQLPPGLLGDAGRRAVAEHLVALVEGPLEPAQGAQPVGQHRPQLEQVGDVAHGVGELAFGHRPLQPVREPVGLGQGDAQHRVDQPAERRGRHAEEPGHDLGVEHGGRDRAAGGHEHVEILRGRVRHGDTGPAEHLGQRRRVDGERVDERHLVGPGDLDERQVGDVGPLGVELGVEAVALLGGDLGRPAPRRAPGSTTSRIGSSGAAHRRTPGRDRGRARSSRRREERARRCKGSGEASAVDHRTHFATGSTGVLHGGGSKLGRSTEAPVLPAKRTFGPRS